VHCDCAVLCRMHATTAVLLTAVGTCNRSSSACRAKASSSISARVAFAVTRNCSSSPCAACLARCKCHRKHR
jgi:hypothetical protein